MTLLPLVKPGDRWSLIMLALVVVAAVLIPSPFSGRHAGAVFDLIHFPAFAGVCWYVLRLWERGNSSQQRHPRKVVVCLAVGAATLEGAQWLTGRSPSWHDLLANVTGVCAGAVVWSAWRVENRLRRSALCLLVVIVGFAISYHPALIVHDGYRQFRDFPLLARFESDAELQRWWRRDISLQRSMRHVTEGRFSGKLIVEPGAYPVMVMGNLRQDWSEYQQLKVEFYLSQDSPRPAETVRLRIADRPDFVNDHDAFVQDFQLLAGQTTTITVSVSDIAAGPRNRELELRRIVSLQWLFNDIQQPFTVYIDNLRLEPPVRN